MTKQRIDLEYILNTSPAILYNRLSSPSGLSEWFCDDVNVEGHVYTFIWKGAQQQARELSRKENKSIRFQWLEDEGEDTFFEFRIDVVDLTGDTALMIIDYVEIDETAGSIELWNQQIDVLKHCLGSH